MGNDGMQLGTLLSLYSIGRTLLLLYSVERTHHCIELVLLPGTLESSLPFRQCLPCSPLSSLVSCSSLAVCCAGVCFLPSRCRSRSYHYYAFNTTHMGEAKFTATMLRCVILLNIHKGIGYKFANSALRVLYFDLDSCFLGKAPSQLFYSSSQGIQ